MSNLTTSSTTEESNQNQTQPAQKFRHRKVLITILVILLIEAPQVISAWISIAEEFSLFYRQNLPSVELIKNQHN
ncbi:hypothetical protein [Argonema antarcticum]|uniref:hypothetical protein n=1 Tax=Argonema antarcticum TaxID=2942763 RepID=UPI0020111258|nr:hypothetical protein [Argonema antarcticum]MCL1475720.1 hypothetical protein [Argonema antarcticum A004/B2]